MSQTLKSSSKEFDAAITKLADDFYALLNPQPNNSNVQFTLYLYADYTVKPNKTDADIIQIFTYAKDFKPEDFGTKELAEHVLRSTMYGDMTKESKLSYFNKIIFSS